MECITFKFAFSTLHHPEDARSVFFYFYFYECPPSVCLLANGREMYFETTFFRYGEGRLAAHLVHSWIFDFLFGNIT